MFSSNKLWSEGKKPSQLPWTQYALLSICYVSDGDELGAVRVVKMVNDSEPP